MKGKRVLITGGNGGLGLATAVSLAGKGAEVVIAGHDSEKTRRALSKINQTADVEAINLPVNLASLASVRELAQTFVQRYDRLDVLINNAGVFSTKPRHTDDGFEMNIGVNHLAHFLLTSLLLETLKASAPARIVHVASKLHKKPKEMDFDCWRDLSRFKTVHCYGQSKLANVMFAIELSHRLEGTGVTSNALHPGTVKTDMVREVPWLLRKLIKLGDPLPDKGAATTIMLASDDSLATTTAKYYNQCELEDCAPLVDDAALRQRFWQLSEEAVGLA